MEYMGWRGAVLGAACLAAGLFAGGNLWWSWAELTPAWAGLSECPRCYGQDGCTLLLTGRIHLQCRTLVEQLAATLGVKNVFIACSDTDLTDLTDHTLQQYNRNFVVLKRLGHDWQLRLLDDKLCSPLLSPDGCDFDTLPDTYGFLMKQITKIVTLRHEILESDEIGLTVCPNPDAVDKIISSSLLNEEADSVLNRIAMVNIWTVMNVNPEPVVMKFLNENGDHWPIPRHLGSCGRIAIQTYEGEMISNFLDRPWTDRALLSINLLNAADLFTFNHSDYRFYLTDISPENIVVKSTEKWEPIFVDLENVIIVDKNRNPQNESQTWYANHASEVIECIGCFAFSSEKICSHHLSDHNHYSICKLLEESVLKDIPDEILKMSPDFPKLITECVSPTDINVDRFATAETLKNELKRLIKNL